MPFLRHQQGLLGQVLGGWQLNSIVSAQSGLPFGVISGARYPAGDFNADGQEGDRPNVPSFGNQFSGTPSNQSFINGVFQVEDFPVPAPGENGNLGRNTFTGPSFFTVDMSLSKDFRLPITEESRVQFRAEIFNLFNRVNLYLPNVDLNSSSFGRSTQTFDAREIQFALKLIF